MKTGQGHAEAGEQQRSWWSWGVHRLVPKGSSRVGARGQRDSKRLGGHEGLHHAKAGHRIPEG